MPVLQLLPLLMCVFVAVDTEPCRTMGYIKTVEGDALPRDLPTVQPTSVARKPKGCADPDLRRQPPARGTQADIHAAQGRQHHPRLRPQLDNGFGLHIPNSPFTFQ